MSRTYRELPKSQRYGKRYYCHPMRHPLLQQESRAVEALKEQGFEPHNRLKQRANPGGEKIGNSRNDQVIAAYEEIYNNDD
jgi:hypothetical protein